MKTLQLSDSSTKVLKCPRKFQIYKFIPKPPRSRENFHGDVGIAIHKAYQEWLRYGDIDKVMLELLINYPHSSFDESNPRHRTKSLEACVPTVEAMTQNVNLAEFEIANIECLDGATRPAIEVPFRIDLPNLSNGELEFNYVGYKDAILWSKVTHSYGVVDIKTHRSSMEDRTAEYIFAEQDIPYGLVLQHILKQRLDKFTTFYIDVFIDIEEPRIKIYEMQRTPEDIQDWIRGLHININLIKLYNSMKWWKREGSQCSNFNNKCEYLDACSIRDENELTAYLLGGQEPEKEHIVDPWIQFSLEE